MRTFSLRMPRYCQPLLAIGVNLLLLYVAYFVTRLVYLAENWSYFTPTLTMSSFAEMVRGGLVFDTAAILVTNIPYIVFMLLPLHWKEHPAYQCFCRWLFVVVNGVMLATNLADAVYFRYTLRRTTTTIFQEFQHEGNMGGIIMTEVVNHWYLVLAFVLLVYALWRLYRTTALSHRQLSWWRYDLACLLSLAAVAPFVVAGIRGGFTKAVRPITISNANQYVDRPTDAALVLNTPFALYRTIGKAVFTVPVYFADKQSMEAVYTPVHTPVVGQPMLKKNVVVLIVESMGREYFGALNRDLDGGRYKGYTPQMDSLIAKSVTFRYSYCNGRKSIDGMPSVLSSIPMFVEPFFLTPSSMNHVSGIASLLASEGYETAFFHGAQRGSMGFQAFARATGFQQYYGREDFDRDDRFGGESEFDGTWAIWDEPFLQYYAAKMSEMRQPFMTAVFTATSHHPYRVPDKYRDVYPEEGIAMHKCVRYTDMALGRFFQTASRQPWFRNTIFVLTSDHTNLSDHAYYQTDLGGFCSPIIIYEADDSRMPEMQDKIAQQIDILPTVMGMVGYDKPYFGFGIDLLNTAPDSTWAVNYLNGIYQYVKHGHVLQFDGQHTRAVYALSDSLMQHNVAGRFDRQQQMEQELKAIIQQYMERMTEDRLMP
ncbi:MAG: LTA synthase family protein [Prevotella sp.]|nr:LTA synthase family protein [Prevotella sp.]